MNREIDPESNQEELINIPYQASARIFSLRAIIFMLIGILVLIFLLADSPISQSNVPVSELSSSKSMSQSQNCVVDPTKPKIQYAIMLDAGSTGSRIHIYSFSFCGKDAVLIDEVFEQIKPGLSSYADDPKAAALSLQALIDKALQVIPKPLQKCTPISLKATAGLRLLGAKKSEAILTGIVSYLKSSPFSVYDKDGVAIMDGKDEAVFAWVTVNYLLKNIGSNIKKPTVAVMDLGGGSTQFVFEPKSSHFKNPPSEFKYELSYGGFQYDLYQHSYLGYGLMESRKTYQQTQISKAIDKSTSKSGSPCFIENQDVKIEHNSSLFSIYGSNSDFDICKLEIQSSILKLDTQCLAKPCSFNGVYQPAISDSFPSPKDSRNIYALSYFFDRVEPFGYIDKISVGDFKEVGSKICQNKLQGIPIEAQKAIQQDSNMCYDFAYMFSLLHHGYGLDLDRELALAKKIDIYETGWCLGATLAMVDSLSDRNLLCR